MLPYSDAEIPFRRWGRAPEKEVMPYWHFICAGVKECPRTVLLLLIVTCTATGPFWQVASPWPLIGTLIGFDDDHVPRVSATYGQLPLTEDLSENCA